MPAWLGADGWWTGARCTGRWTTGLLDTAGRDTFGTRGRLDEAATFGRLTLDNVGDGLGVGVDVALAIGGEALSPAAPYGSSVPVPRHPAANIPKTRKMSAYRRAIGPSRESFVLE